MAAKDTVGRHGENIAARHIEQAGWEVLARNWRCEHGEIDIVARDGNELVVVEVKTRRSATFGSPAEAVTWSKLKRLRMLTGAWLASQDRSFAGVRIEVMEVTLPRAGAAHVERLDGTR
jgi:putative endonuclease